MYAIFQPLYRIEQLTAALCNADPGAILKASSSHPGWFSGFRINGHHVADVNLTLALDDAALLIGLGRLRVALHHVYLLDDDPVLAF
jgi:hypothetical protein